MISEWLIAIAFIMAQNFVLVFCPYCAIVGVKYIDINNWALPLNFCLSIVIKEIMDYRRNR